MMDTDPGPLYGMAHTSPGPSVVWDVPPGHYGMGDALSLSQAPHCTAECPTPCSLFSLQDTREYEVSI